MIENQSIELYRRIQKIKEGLPKMGWEHSDVEMQRTQLDPYYQDPDHVRGFRRSIICGGFFNPPDRPRHVSTKNHKTDKDVVEWFDGINLLERGLGVYRLSRIFFELRKRLAELGYATDDRLLEDNEIGKPCAYRLPWIGSSKASTEFSVRMWYYTNFIRNYFSKDGFRSVIEIGSGFGGLCSWLYPALKLDYYICVDLPENLMLHHYYFAEKGIGPVQMVLEKEQAKKVKPEGVIVVAPWVLPDLALSADLAINTMSFQHMTVDNLRYYFSQIERMGVKAFYTVNRNMRRDPTDVPIASYPMSDRMELKFKSTWISPGVHEERVYRRSRL